MGVTFRRVLVVLCLVIALGSYVKVSLNYHVLDLISYFKKNPGSVFAGPASDYGVGMFYFMRDEFEPATEAFEAIVTDYPETKYMDGTLYRLGESYEALRNWSKAKDTYQAYITQFPNGKDIQMVQSRYERIKYF